MTRALALITARVADGPCTRAELGRVLSEHRVDVSDGIVLGNLIMQAELELMVCSGPLRGKQHTYVLLDQRCPPAAAPEQPATELVRRCVLGHGPISLRDVSRWSGLTLTQIRHAYRDADDLDTVVVDGFELVHHPRSTAAALQTPRSDRVLVLLEYDELTLSFRDLPWPWRGEPPASVPASMINRHPGLIMVGDRLAGYWARSLTDRQLVITAAAADVDPAALRPEVAAMAEFYGVELVLAEG